MQKHRSCRKIHCIDNSVTDKGHHQDSQDDPEGVTKEVHEDDGEEGDGQVKLRSSFLILASTENLNRIIF